MKKNHYKIFLFVFTLSLSFAYLACGKKTDENKHSSQNSNVKTEFEWKDGVSVSDIPDFPVKGNLNGKEVTFLYINFEKWRGPGDNVINFSLVKPQQKCGFIEGFTGFTIINKGGSFNQGDWVKPKFDDDPKTYSAFFKNEDSDKSSVQSNCALNIESITDKTVKGKIALFFNDVQKSRVAGKFEAVICNN